MKTSHLVAIVVAVVAIAIFASEASAYYNPSTGRFLSRDPGPEVPARVGSAIAEYADGMNLYQYVQGRPTICVDITGTQHVQVDNAGGVIWGTTTSYITDAAREVGFNTADDNKGAQADEITKHLREMTGTDIWVYHGHGVKVDSRTVNALSTDEWFWSSHPNYVTSDELTTALEAANGNAVGLAIMFACEACSLKDVFLASGTKCVICYDEGINDLHNSVQLRSLINNLFEGKSLSTAVSLANRAQKRGNPAKMQLHCAPGKGYAGMSLDKLLGWDLKFKEGK